MPKSSRSKQRGSGGQDRWYTGIVKHSQRQTQRVGFYCCLIGNALKSIKERETYVFVSKVPIWSTVLHNRGISKETRGVAPFWYIVRTLGPFLDIDTAVQCAQKWADRTRGCQSKIKKGDELAQLYGVRCRQAIGSLLTFLQRNAPRVYVRTYRRLRQQKLQQEQQQQEQQ